MNIMRRALSILALALLCACQSGSLPARTVPLGATRSLSPRAQRGIFFDKELLWQFDFSHNKAYFIDLVQRSEGLAYRAFEGQLDAARQTVQVSRELAPENATALALAPDHQQLALVLRPDPSSPARLILERSGVRKELSGLTGELEALAWSPDSRKLAVLTRHWNTSSQRDVSRLMLLDAAAAKAVISFDQTLPKLPVDGLNGIEAPPELASLAWSPDGRQLAYTSFQGEGSDIALLDAVSGERRLLTREPDFEFQPAWSPDGTRIFYSRGAVFQVGVAKDPDLTDPEPVPGSPYGFTSRLYAMAPDGMAQRPLTALQAGYVSNQRTWRQREDGPPTLLSGGGLLLQAHSLVDMPSSDPMWPPKSSFMPQLSLLSPQGGQPLVLTRELGGVQFLAYDAAGQRIYFRVFKEMSPAPRELVWSIRPDGSDLRQVKFSSL